MPYRLSVLLVCCLGCFGTQPTSSSGSRSVSIESIGQCLTNAGVELYGASWCQFCQQQLLLFGPDAEQVPYTDCDPNAELEFIQECTTDGVPFGTILPVWIFADGSRLYGVREPAVIARVAGCPYDE